MPKLILTKTSGFTFIELLIGISLMVILFGIGFANFRGFQDRQRLISAVRIFKGDLRFTQKQALAGVKPVGCDFLQGYQLIWVGETKYEIDASCGATGTNYIKVKEVNFAVVSPGNKFVSTFGNVYFNVLGRGVDQDREIRIINEKISQTQA